MQTAYLAGVMFDPKPFRLELITIKQNVRDLMIKELIVLACLITTLALSGCVGSSNTNPPEYIKQTSLIKEGDGLQFYIILADSSGQMTSSDGEVRFTISDKGGDLQSRTINVKASQFQNAKIGMGALQHDALLLNIGRIPFSSMDHTPSGSIKAVVIFTATNGKPMQDETTTYV